MAQKKIKNTGLLAPGVYLGAVLSTGLPPELDTMNWIGDIVPDSLKREDDEDTYKQLKSQETGDVWQELLSEEGTKKFSFATWDFKTDNLLLAMGGEVDSQGSWTPPVENFRGAFYAMAYVSKADDENGLHFVMNYPKVKLKGKMEGIQQEGDGNKLMFEAVLYRPTDASGDLVPDRRYDVVPAAPTNGVVDNTANTFGWTVNPGFPLATSYEYSINGGTSYTDCTVNPQTGITGAVPVGDLLVRVKAVTTGDTKNRAGFTLANKEAFTV